MKIIALAFAFLFFPIAGSAQTLEQDLREMRAEIQRLRQELAELREEVRGKTEVVEARVQEHAQTKVESNSRFPVKIFGTILSNTAWNSGEANWLDIPNIAGPIVPSSGSFTSTLRQSRLGAIVDGPEIGKMKSSAFVAVDFFGGIPNFATGQTMGLPRLLYAYARLDGDRTAFEIGQDHMILAPKNPTSLAAESFPLNYRSGNLYLRTPQIHAERVLASGSFGDVRVVGGIVAPIAGDFTGSEFEFVPPALSGERSRMPGFQSRLSWRATPEGPYEKPAWEFGASSHYSRERFFFQSGTISEPSWAASVDFDWTRGRFGTGGEFYAGKNVDQFGGSGNRRAKSRGGFVEARLAATRRLSLNGGYGADKAVTPGTLSRNSSAFGNFIYQFTPEFSTSLEYRWLGTKPSNDALRRNNHVNLTFAYSF